VVIRVETAEVLARLPMLNAEQDYHQVSDDASLAMSHDVTGRVLVHNLRVHEPPRALPTGFKWEFTPVSRFVIGEGGENLVVYDVEAGRPTFETVSSVTTRYFARSVLLLVADDQEGVRTVRAVDMMTGSLLWSRTGRHFDFGVTAPRMRELLAWRRTLQEAAIIDARSGERLFPVEPFQQAAFDDAGRWVLTMAGKAWQLRDTRTGFVQRSGTTDEFPQGIDVATPRWQLTHVSPEGNVATFWSAGRETYVPLGTAREAAARLSVRPLTQRERDRFDLHVLLPESEQGH
jgi:hypothetical protein